MLLDKTKMEKWRKDNKEYFISKGYKFTRMGDKFEVNVLDLKRGSSIKIKCLCDYCKENTLTPTFNDYLRRNINGIIKKDACIKCKGKKAIESNLLKYGVRSTQSLKEVQLKSKQTNLDRYGVENYSQTNECKKRYKATCQERYGVDNVFQAEAIKKQSRNTMAEKYGFEYALQVKDFKNKIINTTIDRYGVSDVNQLQYIKHQIVKTNLKKYGVICPLQNEKVRRKTIITNLRKYGVKHYSQSANYRLQTSNINNYNWKGGISSISDHLRNSIKEWKMDSFKDTNYKCLLSNSKNNLIIHHIYSFNTIIKETFNILQIPIYKQISKYNLEELKLLSEKCEELHYKYGLGACLNEDIHKIFHREYGKGDNTLEQFEEFKIRYKSGEFNEYVKSNPLSTAI